MNVAIDDARAMLAIFRTSPWRTLHVRTAATELFVAKHGGDRSPMRPHVVQAAVPATAIVATAPHVATVVSIAPIDTMVSAGQVVGRLELLGEPVDVPAIVAGRIVEHLVTSGALVDYGAPLAIVTPV